MAAMRIRGRAVARAPASTANLGPGFDSLGMALSLYTWIDLRQAETTTVTLLGDGLQGVPADKTNLVYRAAQLVFREAGAGDPELDIRIRSDIPSTRGLGSSAAAIVGALCAANALLGEPLSRDELFQLALRMERHPDNVGACLFGGIIAAAWDGNRAEAVRLDPPEALEALVAVPEYELSTAKSRDVLPKRVDFADAVFNVGQSALLTAALAAGRLDLLARAMRDRLHQPYRAKLVPGLETVLQEAHNHGALAAVLSGAGPAVLVLLDRNSRRRDELERFLTEAMRPSGGCVLLWLKPCPRGAAAVALDEGHPDFRLPPDHLLKPLETGVGA
jgi:homoserine kinase